MVFGKKSNGLLFVCFLVIPFVQVQSIERDGVSVEPYLSLFGNGKSSRNINNFNSVNRDLEFDISGLSMIGLRAKAVLNPYVSIGTGISKNMSNRSRGGWSDSNRSSSTSSSSYVSLQSDIDIKQAYEYDFYVSSKLFYKNLELLFGLKELFFKWDALGGTQSSGTAAGSSGDVISTYQQRLGIPYMGFFYSASEHFQGAFLELTVLYSPFVYGDDEYMDQINSTRQVGDFNKGQYYNVSLGVNQPISEYAYIKLGFAYQKIGGIKSDLKQTVYSSGTTATTTTGGDVLEVSTEFLKYSLALGFSF